MQSLQGGRLGARPGSHFREQIYLTSFDFLCFRLYPSAKDQQLPWWISGKEFACQCRRCGLDLWVGKIPWRKEWQPALLIWPGKSHGQRNLAGYSPGDHKESDTT